MFESEPLKPSSPLSSWSLPLALPSFACDPSDLGSEKRALGFFVAPLDAPTASRVEIVTRREPAELGFDGS